MKLFYTILFLTASAITAQAETVFESPLSTKEQADDWTVVNSNNDGDSYTW